MRSTKHTHGRSWPMVLAVLAAAIIPAGCGRSASPAEASIPAPYEQVFRVSQSVLREYRFDIDRIDRRAGLIETFPMTGKSWFEFWRKDGATARDTLESTLQTIYRKAIVRVVPAGEQAYAVKVRIAVSRADRREVQITTTSQSLALFRLERGSRRYEKTFGLVGDDRGPVELPDDQKLAMNIQSAIEKRLAAAARTR